MGGSFANWGLAFSCFDCSLQYVRKKVCFLPHCCLIVHAAWWSFLHHFICSGGPLECDLGRVPYRRVSAGEAHDWCMLGSGCQVRPCVLMLRTCAVQLRHGWKSAAQSAAFGGFLLALIEGVGIALNKMTSPPPPGLPYQPPMGAPGGPPLPSGGESFSDYWISLQWAKAHTKPAVSCQTFLSNKRHLRQLHLQPATSLYQPAFIQPVSNLSPNISNRY